MGSLKGSVTNIGKWVVLGVTGISAEWSGFQTEKTYLLVEEQARARRRSRDGVILGRFTISIGPSSSLYDERHQQRAREMYLWPLSFSLDF